MVLFMLNRSIPILTIDDGDLVKTKKFKSYKYLGDPINTLKVFNEKLVDEIIILDISKESRRPDYDLIKSLTNEAFMPLTYGGGITEINQMKRIFRLGVEKISLNSSSYFNPQLIKEAVSFFGSQSIIASIDYKYDLFNRSVCYVNNGKKRISVNPTDLAIEYHNLGVGEILLTAMDRDGTKMGYDFTMIEKISKSVPIPVIANGGASSKDDLVKAIDIHGANAAAAGALFVFQGPYDAVLISYQNIN